ncbi:MAG: amidase [Pseudomonadota bacterium]
MSQTSPAADIHDLQAMLKAKKTTHETILESALAQAHSPACRQVYMPGHAPQPQAVPAKCGPGPLAGMPFSVKDLFDVADQATLAGSTVRVDAPAATVHSTAVSRLLAAGGVMAGRTNMVEFAFSGVGINPHYGTPVNPADSDVQRIPGGSSSGAAVSVATGAAMLGLGSDTGGSIRIPAALCGIVGFKSTARLVPADGALPLSTTLDTVSALTRSVRDAVTVHEVLAARKVTLAGKPLADCRFGVARTWMLDGVDATVSAAFERTLARLQQTGAQVEYLELEDIGELATINATGGLSAAESYAWHRELITTRQAEYDPRVAVRILKGASMSAADYINLLAARTAWIAKMDAQIAGYDAMLSPTVPIVAPPISSLADDTEFFRVNGLLLRNTAVVNMLDGCALSLPCHQHGELPVGLMVWHSAMKDDAVLDLSLQIEAALSQP